MKKKYLLITFLLCTFIFSINVKAFKWECDNLEINRGEYVTCTRSDIDAENKEEIYVYSELEIYESDVSNPVTKDGKIKFSTKKTSGDSFNVTAESNINGIKTKTIKIKTTTTKKTTTSTTTTKAKSDNNYLASISVNGEEIEDFSKTKTKYFVDVENDVKKVNIKAEAEDENATIEVDGPKVLEVGDNEYTISVTSENNTTKFYKIVVTRKDEEESSITDIKNIKIKGYHLNFDKNSKTFYLSIDKEDTELDIDVITKDKNADYEIEGNENLEDGSVIKIIVTAENGSTDTYRIIIQKEATNFLPVIIGSIVLIILIVVIIIVIVKKNNKKDNNKDKKDKKVDDKKSNDKEVSIEEEKTIEMAPITAKEVASTNDSEMQNDEIEITHIDNDEEEETRILSYAEREELEKTKLLDDELSDKIDEELEKTLLFDFDNEM